MQAGINGIPGSTVLTVLADFGSAVNYPSHDWYQYLGTTAMGDL